MANRFIPTHVGNTYTWANGADNLDKPGAKHPKEDWRCRCYPKPVLRPPDSLAQSTENARGRNAQNEDIEKVISVYEEQERRLGVQNPAPVEHETVQPLQPELPGIKDSHEYPSSDEAGKRFFDNFPKYDEIYTAEEQESLAEYRGKGYDAINRSLRSMARDPNFEPTENVARHIKNIDSAMEKAQLKEDTVLYRGFYSPKVDAIIQDGIKGVKDEFPEFVSTSFAPDATHYFARTSAPKRFLARIQTPAGTNISRGHSEEMEAILRHGTEVIIKDWKTVDLFEFPSGQKLENVIIIDMEVY